MPTTVSGVYPCYKNQFKIGAPGAQTLNTIADCQTFGIAFNDGVEEWSSYDSDGWLKRLKTSKNIVISVTGKRNIGDDGNDFVASLAFLNGTESEADFEWTFYDGTKVKFENAVVVLKSLGGGDATNAAPIEFDVMSNGQPTVTPAA